MRVLEQKGYVSVSLSFSVHVWKHSVVATLCGVAHAMTDTAVLSSDVQGFKDALRHAVRTGGTYLSSSYEVHF